jgi:type IV pilus assembly protein PilY1
LIKNDAQSFVAPVVPVSQTNRTESGDRLYVALFSPREGQQEWPGNIKKYALDRNNGTICNAGQTSCTSGSAGAATLADGTILQTAQSFWDASTGGPSGSAVTSGGVGAVLKASNIANRKIYTYTGTGTGNLGLSLTAAAQAFSKANSAITPAKLGLLAPDDTTAERDLLIDYIYGYDSYDADNDGVHNEVRNWILGDIIHSVPLIVNYNASGTDAAIIVGANDGMLHAFDDASGAELWAFVPPDVLDNLNELRPGESGTHPFFVDASAKVYHNGSQKILVFGLGRGGRAYYGLDITSKSSPTLLWRVNETTSGYAELGLTMSTPALTKTSLTPSPVAVVGGGYDEHFDDPEVASANTTGAMGRTIYVINILNGTKVTQASGVAGMSFAIPSDPLVFDVNGDKVFDRGYIGDMGGNMWRILDDFTIQRLFSTPSGLRIYYQPDAVINNGSVMVYFGTGDRSSPLYTEAEDRFYAVRDDGTNDLQQSDLENVTNTVVQPGSQAEIDLIEEIAEENGWYIELGADGEKVLAPPTAFFNVAFTTFTPSTELCDAGGEARIYVVNPLTGSPSLDLAGTSGGTLGNGAGTGSGANGALTVGDRFVLVGQSIPTSLKVTFGDDETKAFFGVTKGGGIGLQPLNLPQMQNNVIPVSWRQVW